MKNAKRILSILLTLLMLASTLSVLAVPASADGNEFDSVASDFMVYTSRNYKKNGVTTNVVLGTTVSSQGGYNYSSLFGYLLGSNDNTNPKNGINFNVDEKFTANSDPHKWVNYNTDTNIKDEFNDTDSWASENKDLKLAYDSAMALPAGITAPEGSTYYTGFDIDLSAAKKIGGYIMHYNGDDASAQQNFDVWVSADGTSWERITSVTNAGAATASAKADLAVKGEKLLVEAGDEDKSGALATYKHNIVDVQFESPIEARYIRVMYTSVNADNVTFSSGFEVYGYKTTVFNSKNYRDEGITTSVILGKTGHLLGGFNYSTLFGYLLGSGQNTNPQKDMNFSYDEKFGANEEPYNWINYHVSDGREFNTEMTDAKSWGSANRFLKIAPDPNQALPAGITAPEGVTYYTGYEINLGKSRDIGGYVMHFFENSADFHHNFDIWISVDGTNWERITTVTNKGRDVASTKSDLVATGGKINIAAGGRDASGAVSPYAHWAIDVKFDKTVEAKYIRVMHTSIYAGDGVTFSAGLEVYNDEVVTNTADTTTPPDGDTTTNQGGNTTTNPDGGTSAGPGIVQGAGSSTDKDTQTNGSTSNDTAAEDTATEAVSTENEDKGKGCSGMISYSAIATVFLTTALGCTVKSKKKTKK